MFILYNTDMALHRKHYYREDKDEDLECRVELDSELSITYIANFMGVLC